MKILDTTVIAVFSILGSIGAIILAAIFLIFPEKIRRLLIPLLVSYAIGTLLAGAFLGLIYSAPLPKNSMIGSL